MPIQRRRDRGIVRAIRCFARDRVRQVGRRAQHPTRRAWLHEHVEINGEYFELIDGGYTLKATPDGGTDLSLTTRFINKSRLQAYGNLWGKLVLKGFHRSILGLMKSRSELANAFDARKY